MVRVSQAHHVRRIIARVVAHPTLIAVFARQLFPVAGPVIIVVSMHR